MRIVESDSESDSGVPTVACAASIAAVSTNSSSNHLQNTKGTSKQPSPVSPLKVNPPVVNGNGGVANKSLMYKSPTRASAAKITADESDASDVPLAWLAAKPTTAGEPVFPVVKPDPGAISIVSPIAKKQPTSPTKKRPVAPAVLKDDNDSGSENSDVPLSNFVKKRPPHGNAAVQNGKKPLSLQKKSRAVKESDSDSDVPLSKIARKKAAAAATEQEEDSTDSDVPLIQKLKNKKKAVAKANSRKRSHSHDSADESTTDGTPAKKARSVPKDIKKKPKAPKMPKDSPKKSDNGDEESGAEQDDNEYKWWKHVNEDDGIKWTDLQHNGVWFPPPYLPHGVQMKYEGKSIKLSPASEEVAGFFAQVLGTQYADNPTFCANFFEDFLAILKENDPDCPIKKFEKCDFSPMLDYFMQQKEIKKNMTKEEKERIKADKKIIDDEYGWANIDGRREKIGNFRVEPPGLFRGRGDHPKTGKLKLRVTPEQVTINIGENAKVPQPPEGHKWGGVIHDNTVSWLATWTENVNGNIKYVFFAANSSLKGMSDFKKFEKARELKSHIQKIRQDYMSELKDNVMMIRQRATVMWLIDKLALRAGNEKGEDEADTVGCCSLRYEHIRLEEDECEVVDRETGENKIIAKKMVVFDFLGKDSIRYYNRVQVDPVVWKNLKIFRREPKKEGDPIFDRLNTSLLNKHLTSLMPGLTAKVFRTYNASHTFQEELKKTPVDGTVAEKNLAYNRSNRQVAILCNHQRTVSKAHGTQMEKLDERILALKYDRYLVRRKLLEADPKVKKRMPEVAEEESDMDEDTIERKKSDKEQLEMERLEKRYEKMCEKAKAEGKPKPPKPELVDDADREVSVDRLEKQFESLSTKIINMKTMRTDKDENKTTALGTSKINYIDPRITAAWCKKYEVPVEKMFNKSLREKFKWAMDVDGDWTF